MLPSFAQSQKPVSHSAARIVIGVAPGASGDTVSRYIAEDFEKALGRTFIVEYKAGASNNIAADFVAKSRPDGNTLLGSTT